MTNFDLWKFTIHLHIALKYARIQELLTFDNFSAEWWTLCVKIDKHYVVFVQYTLSVIGDIFQTYSSDSGTIDFM